jgi:hypothetical protein
MTASGRASPGVGHNGGLPDEDAIRHCLAIELIYEEKAKLLREEIKRARKGYERRGVNLDRLKWLKGMQDLPVSDIEASFRQTWHYAGAVFESLKAQFDLFAPKAAEPASRAAHFTAGLMQGLRGEELVVPPIVVGDERQQMIDGHNEGRERRAKASEEILEFALKPENKGKPTDGTKAGVTAAAVNQKAAEDFAKDQGDDPLVVNGEKYPTIRQANAARARLEKEQEAAAAKPEEPALETQTVADAPQASVKEPNWRDFDDDPDEWFAVQKQEAAEFFASLPKGTAPDTDHAGALAAYAVWLAAKADDGFEATAEELAGQKDRPKPEVPDEKEVAEQARKLEASGFTDSAKKPRGRPAKS